MRDQAVQILLWHWQQVPHRFLVSMRVHLLLQVMWILRPFAPQSSDGILEVVLVLVTVRKQVVHEPT